MSLVICLKRAEKDLSILQDLIKDTNFFIILYFTSMQVLSFVTRMI